MKTVKKLLPSLQIITSTILTAQIASAFLPSSSAVTCQSLFSGLATQTVSRSVASEKVELPFGFMTQSYVTSEKSYTKEIPYQPSIRNQGDLGTCHLHAWAGELEAISSVVTRGQQKVKISTRYLSVLRWYEQTLKTLNEGVGLEVQYGAALDASLALIQRYGIIPEEAWKPLTPFEESTLHGRIEEYAANIIARHKMAIAESNSLKDRENLYNDAIAQVTNLFANVIGEMPEKFQFEGKEYTPQEFAMNYFIGTRMQYTVINRSMVRADIVAKTESRNSKQFDAYIVGNPDLIELGIRESIDKGLPVVLGYEHNSAYVDMKSGVMSIGAFKMPKNAQPLQTHERLTMGTFSGAHAVMIVGYEEDPRTHKVLRWKILNSWSDRAGDKGYFHMYRDFFRQFMLYAYIPKTKSSWTPTPNYELPKQLGLFDDQK